jgi:type I restriction enzyme M protein
LVIQKYTKEQLENIEAVQKQAEADAPDYAKQVKDLIDKYKNDTDIPEEEIPEEIFEILLEEYPEPEISEDDTSNAEDEENPEPLSLEEKLELADEKISELKTNLLKAKEKLMGLDDEIEALKAKQKSEIEIALENWKGTKKEFNTFIKPVKEEHKQSLKELKERQKEQKKQFTAEIKLYEKQIPLAEEEKLLLTNKGKLQILLNSEDAIKTLKNRFVDAQVAKELDYPIFMAVSERGGKNNSGDYEYLTDENGNIVEDSFGNPEINQDLVNHKITREELLNNAKDIADEDCNIAEAFVKFAKEQKFDFWED